VLAAIVVTTLLWASAFVVLRALRSNFEPGPLVFGRLLVGCVVLSALMLAQRVALPPRRELPAIVACGVLWFGAYNVALAAGERLIDAGTAAMLVNVAPVSIALAAVVVLRERLSRPLLTGLGVALCLGAAAAYTAAVIIQKPLLARVSPTAVTWGACVAGTVVCAPFAPALVSELGRAPASSTLLVAYLGAGPTAIAFTTWAFALSRSSMARQGATTYLVPPLVIALSWITLDEVPAALALLGGALCLLGVAITRRRAV
jgi:drug/metabolite transporter (DMT)-like permease